MENRNTGKDKGTATQTYFRICPVPAINDPVQIVEAVNRKRRVKVESDYRSWITLPILFVGVRPDLCVRQVHPDHGLWIDLGPDQPLFAKAADADQIPVTAHVEIIDSTDEGIFSDYGDKVVEKQAPPREEPRPSAGRMARS